MEKVYYKKLFNGVCDIFRETDRDKRLTHTIRILFALKYFQQIILSHF